MSERIEFSLRSRAALLALLCCTCNADEADCSKLGEKFVELYRAELDEDSRKLAPVVIDNAAEAGRSEVVEQCRRATPSKLSIERCLSATSMDEFKKC